MPLNKEKKITNLFLHRSTKNHSPKKPQLILPET